MLEIFSLFILGLVALYLISFSFENFIRHRKNLAPGPYKWPILGNLVQVAWINYKEPYLAFGKLGEKYGSMFSFQMGSVYSVVFNSFDVMEEYLTKSEFTDRYYNDWMGERTLGKRLGLGTAQYPFPWISLRRLTLRTLREFGFGTKSSMESIIHAEIMVVISELKASLKENNGIHTFDNFFVIPVLNVIWTMLAGTRYEHTDPKLLRLTSVVNEFLTNSNFGNNILVAFPEWRSWFPDWTGMNTLRRCFRETTEFFQEFIEERKSLGAYKTSPENLVDEFLHEIEARSDGYLTEQQLVAVMSDFFMAGSETTSNTLSWLVLHILLNPEVQTKLQKEIDSIVPKGTFPTPEHESRLHYVRATLAENHRSCSLVPMMIPRAPTQDMVCGKFLIPKGTNIITNLYGMHHDKSYWKDPETFRPERFLGENGKFKIDPRLKPFGFGKRACIGEPLASMNLLYFLVVLVQNFTFRTVPNDPIPSLKGVVGITRSPQKFRALVEYR